MSRVFLIILLLLLFVNPIKAQNIEDVSEAGSYEVTITAEDAEGNQTQKEVLLLIKFRNTIVDTSSREAIDAVNIRYTKDEDILAMKSSELIERANARAWNIDTGTSVDITSIDIKGTNVTFATENNTAITIQVFQVESLGMNLKSNYIEPLVGRNFSVASTLAFISSLILVPVILILLFQQRVQKEYRAINETLYK